ncbi:MAG: DUF1848 domain-containing protein [Kiloniellaceae bacterium]
MIVSASYRTDVPAFYAEWFRRRLDEGSCRVVNPYGGQPYEVPLTGPAVDGFVFWTRNIGPFRDTLAEVAARGLPFVVQYTVTGYPRALETSVSNAERSIALIRDLAGAYGPRAVVWRYDPLLATSLTPPAWHRRTFARLARALAGAVDEVVFSFAQIYEKTRANLSRAALRHGFTWDDPPDEAKRALLSELAGLAADFGLTPTLCAQPHLLAPGLEPARCIDAARLAEAAGHPIAARTKGNRPGCLCAESRDIGAYDTCPHGCVYCYAVRRPDLAKRNHRRHDPDRPFVVSPTASRVPISKTLGRA